jgi:osmotically-inducible protein OsmY
MSKQLFFILGAALALTACAPAVLFVGSGTAVGTMATREKGVTGTVSDSWISAQIKTKFYAFNRDLHARIVPNVQNGEVLLTGSVTDAQWPIEAERMCWEVKGVKVINNEVTIEGEDTPGFGQYASDALITSQMKTHLMFDKDIRSLNYSIRTVKGVVYVMGTAQSQAELDKVLAYARNTKGVDKVMDYVHMREGADNEPAGSEPEGTPQDQKPSTGVGSTPAREGNTPQASAS